MDSLRNITSLSQTGFQSPKQDDEKPYSSKSPPLGPGLRKIGFHESRKATAFNIPSPEKKLQQLPSQVTIVKGVSRIEPQSLSGAVCQDTSFFPDDKQQLTFPLSAKQEKSIEQTPKPQLQPLSYVEKLTATPVYRSLESPGQSAQVKVRSEPGRLESHIRINEAIQRRDWHPPLLEELKLQPWSHFSQKVNTYLKYLQNVLKGVSEPIEACIRVTSCINYLQEMLRPDENDNFNLLRLKFESIYKLTLHPCIVEIRKQTRPGLAKEYFEALHQAINIFHFHPFHRKAPSDEVRAEIRNTLTTMIQSELDYLSYAAKLSNRCDNHWAITRLQWTLGEGGPARRFDFLRPDKRKQYLANVASIEKEQSQASVAPQDRASAPEKIHLNTQEIDSIIASGDLEKAADFLSAHRGKFPMQERLLCQILKYELDKVLETFTQEKNRENDLSLLAALYSFRKTFRKFIPIHHFLNKDTQNLLSAVVVRVLSSHITIITPPDRKLKIERMIQELIKHTTMTDQCISMWRKFQHGEIILEDSLEGMTSYDAFQALIKISSRLSSEPAVNNDFLIAAQEIRVWALNEKTVRKMNDGIRLSKMLAALKHKLYLHFFHHIYKDGSMRKPGTLTEYNKVISKMDCHRKNCIENQKLLYLLKDDKQRKSWQLIACQAWGQYICNLRKKIFRSESISDQDISNLLLLKGISPDIDLGFTRVDFKKLAIDIFNSAVKTPHLVQVRPDKLQALSGWVLALLDTEPKDIPAAMKRNEEVKTSISAYRTRCHQQVLAATGHPSSSSPQPIPEPETQKARIQVEHSPQEQDSQATAQASEVSHTAVSKCLTRLPQKSSEVCLVDNPATQTQKELNLLLVTDRLKEEFGCSTEAMKAVDQKAREMGVTRKSLQDMAQINPSSFKKLMGLDISISVDDILSGNRPINFIQPSLIDDALPNHRSLKLSQPSFTDEILSGNRPFSFIQSSSVNDGGNTKISTTQNTGQKPVSPASHETQQAAEPFLNSQKTNNQPILQTNNIASAFAQLNRHPTEKKVERVDIETAQVHAFYDTLNQVPSCYPATAAPATTSYHIPQDVPQNRRYHTPMDLLTAPPLIPQLEKNSHKQNVQASNIAPAISQLPRYPERKAAHSFVRDNRVNTFHETPSSVQPIYPIASAPEATSYPTAQIIHHDMRYNVQAELLTAHHLPAQQPPCNAPFSEIPFTPSEPSNYLYVHRVFEESLLVYLPHTNTIHLHEDHLLEENLKKIELILQILYQRLQGDIRYKLVEEHEIQHIDDCINALTPWFKKFHITDQAKYTELDVSLKYLTKPVENGKIDQTFRDLVNDQIIQGKLAEAAQIIRVQQGLYHVREVLGLSVNYAP